MPNKQVNEILNSLAELRDQLRDNAEKAAKDCNIVTGDNCFREAGKRAAYIISASCIQNLINKIKGH
jgi:hypothetical protein